MYVPRVPPCCIHLLLIFARFLECLASLFFLNCLYKLSCLNTRLVWPGTLLINTKQSICAIKKFKAKE